MFAIQFALLLLLCEVIHCLEPKCPKTGAAAEKSTGEPFGQGIFPVEVSLHSDLGRRLNHDSQQLQLSPPNQHPKLSRLKTEVEDSPSKDKVTPFDYLEDESNIFTKEEKITDDRRMTFTRERKPVLKILKRSKRGLKEEIDLLTDYYKTEQLKQCCGDGYDHYMNDNECHEWLKEKKNMQRPRCYQAFKECCTYSLNYFVKEYPLGGKDFTRWVSMPSFWKVSEPQKVTLICRFRSYGVKTCLVKIKLLSYPDKNVTYDSHELNLNPTSETQTDVNLLIKLEDLPNKDELEQFVYFQITSHDSFMEKKIPLLDLRVTQKDLKKPNGSIDKLGRQIEILANKYHIWKVKKTCRDAYQHYIFESECQSKMKVFEEEGNLGLHRVFRKCCLHTREYIHRLANTEPYYIRDGW